MEGTDRSIARLDTWVTTVVNCSLKKEERAERCKTELSKTYGIIVDAATYQLIMIISEIVKHRSRKEVGIKEEGTDNKVRRGAVKRLSSTATNIWKLLFVRRMLIPADGRWFWKDVTDKIGSANNCFVRKAPSDSHIKLWGVLAEKYNISELVN